MVDPHPGLWILGRVAAKNASPARFGASRRSRRGEAKLVETTTKNILLTGATGYVGGRLLPLLEEAGHEVRCLARNPRALEGVAAPRTRLVRGDLLEPESLEEAFEGVEVAYYLVHSMGDGADFVEHERRAARNFAEAARSAGVQRIVYLGGLVPRRKEPTSPHLASRVETGRLLAASGIETLNRDPVGKRSSYQTSPPITRASLRAIGSPSPRPPVMRSRASSVCTTGWNTRSRYCWETRKKC